MDEKVTIRRAEYEDLVRCEERIDAVKRLYESGNCYTLDTALAALGIKMRGAERVTLHGDPCADDGK